MNVGCLFTGLQCIAEVKICAPFVVVGKTPKCKE